MERIHGFLQSLLPSPLRQVVRSRKAGSRQRSLAEAWPIDERAGASPSNWPGWPDHKQFGLVLTHDVVGSKGEDRVEAVMDMEQALGFRSCFNFTPEAPESSSERLRRKLQDTGFEVGLLASPRAEKAFTSRSSAPLVLARERQFMELWDAVGYRAGRWAGRQAWLQQLGVEYDSSTYDTDLFCASQNCVATVFPYWIGDSSDAGFVELPRTLPSDYSLFVALGQTSIATWKEKLDWIAGKGGMALLSLHPDCMNFLPGSNSAEEYPATFYEEFLSYVREEYDGCYWAATPREAARWYCERIPAAARHSRKNVLMISYNYYDGDNRVRRYAEALARRGDRVEAIAVSESKNSAPTEQVSGVTVYRRRPRVRNERNWWTFAWRALRYLVESSLFLTSRERRIHYDFIHVHNPPDFLVFATWYARRRGAKLLLDVHDIMPELFTSKFKVGDANVYVRLLRAIEKLSMAYVDHVIVSNHLWQERLLSRSVRAEKCSVFLNHVDQAVFYPRVRTRKNGTFVLLFPGTFQWHQGLDIAIDALALLRDSIPGAELHLYGGGPMTYALKEQARRLGLQDRVRFMDGVPLDCVADVIANADVGVVPKRADSFGNEAFSTKIMEFMSQRIPVVVARTKIDTFYFDDQNVQFFPSGDAQGMAEAILHLYKNSERRRELVEHGWQYIERHNWGSRRKDYLDLVDSLSLRPVSGPTKTRKNKEVLIEDRV